MKFHTFNKWLIAACLMAACSIGHAHAGEFETDEPVPPAEAQYVFRQATNLTLPHGARAISQLGQAISLDQLQPGDLVFFNTLKTAFSHVGIYIGDNRFIHAPTKGDTVRIVNMNEDYWVKRFNGARRLAQPSQLSPAAVSAE